MVAATPRSSVGPLSLAKERAAFVVESVGGATAAAALLGVAKSQPSRWKSGAERPGFDAAPKLLALDSVLALAQLVWERDVALDWLQSPNSHLGGARPIDVTVTRGPAEVLDVLRSIYSGVIA